MGESGRGDDLTPRGGMRAHVTQIERVARYIWWVESGRDEEWSRFLDAYRNRARIILTTPDGWRTNNEYTRRLRRPEV